MLLLTARQCFFNATQVSTSTANKTNPATPAAILDHRGVFDAGVCVGAVVGDMVGDGVGARPGKGACEHLGYTTYPKWDK